MKRMCWISLLIFFSRSIPALQISEIFYQGNELFPSETRYIEIYNESSNPADLSKVILSVPRSDSAVTNIALVPGRFELIQNGVITNSFLLKPGQCAVVMTEAYNDSPKLFAFASNTILLKPKNQSFSQWSWADRLSLFRLSSNGTVLFDCSGYSFTKDIKPGSSLHLRGNSFVSGPLSPGIQSIAVIESEMDILHEGDSSRITYSDPAETAEEIIASATVYPGNRTDFISLSRTSSGVYSGMIQAYPGLNHGDSILIRAGNSSRMIRYLEKRPLSPDYRKVLINEIVADPHTDYSGGGWSGEDGCGTVSETDEWIELASLLDHPLNLSNSRLFYQSPSSESIKKLSFRWNTGFGNKCGVLSNRSYLIATPDGGTGNKANLTLYDFDPYRGGRILDQIEYGNDDISGDGVKNNAPSAESSSKADESLSRMPNGAPSDRFNVVFRKTKSTFGAANGTELGMIFAEDVIGTLSNTVYLVDTNNLLPEAEIIAESEVDREIIRVTNRGLHFSGTISLTTDSPFPDDGVLTVKNGGKIRLTYRDQNPQADTVWDFLWLRDGWKLPSESEDFEKTVVYPNPIHASVETSIIFANVPEGTEISIFDLLKNKTAGLSGVNGGAIIWKTALRKGIYFAYLKHGKSALCRKLLVF